MLFKQQKAVIRQCVRTLNSILIQDFNEKYVLLCKRIQENPKELKREKSKSI